MSDHLQVYINN